MSIALATLAVPKTRHKVQGKVFKPCFLSSHVSCRTHIDESLLLLGGRLHASLPAVQLSSLSIMYYYSFIYASMTEVCMLTPCVRRRNAPVLKQHKRMRNVKGPLTVEF